MTSADLALPPPPLDIASAIGGWLLSCSEATRAAYARDAASYALWRGLPTPAALAELLDLGPRRASLRVEEYRDGMRLPSPERPHGLSSATVSRRLATLRSFVKKQRVGWTLDVRDPKKEKRRDSRGPTWEKYLAIVAAEPDPCVGSLLRVMGDRGLRIHEALGIQLADVELDFAAVWIVGKGRSERERVGLSEPTGALLRAWVERRGLAPGPVWDFSYSTARRAVMAAGERVGVRLSPHALRHAAITRALDTSNGDARQVRAFSRHSSIETVVAYDDARQDMASEVARRVTEG